MQSGSNTSTQGLDHTPARRLLATLVAAEGQQDGAKVSEAWANVLNVSAKDTPRLYRALADVRDLVEEVRLAITADASLDQHLYLLWYDSARFVTEHRNLDDRWGTCKAALHEHKISSLRFAVAHFAGQRPREMPLDREFLAELTAEASRLLREVTAQVEDPALRSDLARRLTGIIHAVSDYRVGGAAGLSRAAAEAIGQVMYCAARIVDAGATAIAKGICAISHRIHGRIGLKDSVLAPGVYAELGLSAGEPSAGVRADAPNE